MDAPEHACAILTLPDGRLALQLRPAHLRHAANQLTCFGGKREAGEDSPTCLRRELREETGWDPGVIVADGIDLRSPTRWIARFHHVPLHAGVALVPEPGFVVVLAPLPALPGLPLSPWHHTVIDGWLAGLRVVAVTD
jgi:8-oxo-dGTP pyrophosphatase MutT (NUDIX family)